MEARALGNAGLRVSAIGLGVMGMSEFYGDADSAENTATLARAVELGVTFWDTADAYGSGHNEEMIGAFVAERSIRDQLVVATKFGFVREGGRAVGISGKPEYVRNACDASLARPGFDTIDLYYQHRVDPQVPIEETVGAMAELVKAGKVRHSAPAASSRRAASWAPDSYPTAPSAAASSPAR
jgi:aryl-alcohol dehydrogenase-like predicted oxidoreductase